MTREEKREFNENNQNDYFFAPMTAQRRELRKLWNLKENNVFDWEVFLYDSEIKVLKISDALKLSFHEISITYGIDELLKMYNELYKIKPTQDKIKDLKNKVSKLNEELTKEINEIVNELPYKESSLFSYNMDRLKQFNDNLQNS